jgi:hypothetical protein
MRHFWISLSIGAVLNAAVSLLAFAQSVQTTLLGRQLSTSAMCSLALLHYIHGAIGNFTSTANAWPSTAK